MSPGMERFSSRSSTSCSKRMCLGSGVWGWVEFVIGDKGLFWTCDLKLGQAMRNIGCGDWWVLVVQIGYNQNAERERIISAASFHGLSIIHTFLPCPSSRRVSPCVLYSLLLPFIFSGWWAGEYGFSILEINAILIYLLFHYFIYLFILGKRPIYNKI